VKLRGISVLTRKIIVTRRFGVEAWQHVFRDVASAHHCFRSLITADSLVPLPAYLALHDEIVRRFYHDDEASNFELGRESARWALVEGPYKKFMRHRNLAQFVGSFPKLWSMYFTDTHSHSEATINRDSVEFKTFDLPQWHPYFEHLVIGYMTEVLEMFCANPIEATRLRGGGGKTYHYLLHTAAGERRRAGSETSVPSREATPYLSNREVEVMLLVAAGNTNDEIGLRLGISGKTAQHHVAHAYRKMNVSGRVGAVMWLAERGLVGKATGAG